MMMCHERWLTHALILVLLVINVYNLICSSATINCMQVIWGGTLMNVSKRCVLRRESIFRSQSKRSLRSVLIHIFMWLINLSVTTYLAILRSCSSGHHWVIMSKLRSIVVHFILRVSSWSKRQLMMMILHKHLSKLTLSSVAHIGILR